MTKPGLMRKLIIWIVGLSLLTFLTIRLFKSHIDGVKSERQWYIRQLDFQFSGEIDSVSNSHILFHVTDGNLNRQQEKRIKKQLKYNGRLDLLLFKQNGNVNLMIDSAYKYRRGDSIYLNTDENTVKIFRDKRLISDDELVKSLRGRPF